LVLLSKDRKATVNIIPSKEGAIHDYAWCSRRHIFVVVAGKSPARCTVFDGKTGDPLFQYGDSHKNIACYSPSGRFLCLAGFGNLAGGMDFWESKKSKLLGSGKSDAAVGYGWSPCGRMFMTATLAPRMNVDNGVTLYDYRGDKISHWPADKKGSVLGSDGLLECKFLPVRDGTFPDLPASPKPEGAETASSTAASAKSATEKKVYRPPGATALSNRISEEMKGTQLQPASAKSKNSESKPKAQAPAKAEKKVEPVVEQAQDADEEKDPEKLMRKYKKLLRQIEDLEEKGAALDDSQKAKVAKKPEILQKIKLIETKMTKS